MKNLFERLLLTSIILGTSFMPVSAADIVPEYSVEIESSAADEFTVEDHFEVGTKLADDGRYFDAIEEFSRAIELDPNFADAYNERGNAYAKLGKYDEAIQDLSRYIDLSKHNELESYDSGGYMEFLPSVYTIRGFTYDLTEKYDEAIRDFSEVIKLDPNSSLAYNG